MHQRFLCFKTFESFSCPKEKACRGFSALRHEFLQMVLNALTASWCMCVERRDGLLSVVSAWNMLVFVSCFRDRFPLKDVSCSPLRLHALRGLKGDATECKSNFRITYISVYKNFIASCTGPKCFYLVGFFLFFFWVDMKAKVYFSYFAKKKKEKRFI